MRRGLLAATVTGVILILTGPARADDQAELKALIDKAIKAHGGEANLTRYKAATWKAKGKVHIMGGIDFTGDWHEMDGKFRFSIDMNIMGMAINSTQVVTRDKGWLKVTAGGNVAVEMEMTKEMIDEGQEELYANRIMSLQAFAAKEKGLELAPIGEVMVNGKACIGVRISSKGRRDVSLLIDKETHLVAKGEHRSKDFQEGGKEYNQEYFLSDYKEFDGVKDATKLVMHRDGNLFLDVEVTEYKRLDKLDDSVFQKP